MLMNLHGNAFACQWEGDSQVSMSSMSGCRAKGSLSAGVVESFNGKAKLTMKKAYGYRTPEALQIAMYHAFGKLPEPKFTHRFW